MRRPAASRAATARAWREAERLEAGQGGRLGGSPEEKGFAPIAGARDTAKGLLLPGRGAAPTRRSGPG